MLGLHETSVPPVISIFVFFFAKIAGTKTLTLETLKAVKSLGYEIEQVTTELLKV